MEDQQLSEIPDQQEGELPDVESSSSEESNSAEEEELQLHSTKVTLEMPCLKQYRSELQN